MKTTARHPSLGAPPKSLPARQVKIWRQIVAQAAPGTFRRQDGPSLETFCLLEARIRSGRGRRGDKTVALAYLGEFLLTPASRRRVIASRKVKGRAIV